MRRSLTVVSFALLAGCYNPKIDEGAFQCGPNNACPSGFTCVAMFCVKPGTRIDMASGPFVGDGKLGRLDLTGTTGTTVTADTETGEMILSGGTLSGPMPLVMANADGFKKIDQPNGPRIALWQFQVLVIPPTVTVRPSTTSGSNVAAFAATERITMAGTIDWKTFGGFPGGAGDPGQDVASGAMNAQPGGDGSGGGGGGYSQMGMNGAGPTGGRGGGAYGQASVITIHVGQGGAGGGPKMGASIGGRGGPGGGAVVLASRLVQVLGRIDVAGSPGRAGTGDAGGGGGGAGGTIALSGDEITLGPSHSLNAAGGMPGPGSGTGMPGGRGADGRIWAGAPIVTNQATSADMTVPFDVPAITQSAEPILSLPRR
jgi:hypothetical protein